MKPEAGQEWLTKAGRIWVIGKRRQRQIQAEYVVENEDGIMWTEFEPAFAQWQQLMPEPPLTDQPAEDPDEWVIQDRVPPRAHIDVVFWSHWKHGEEVVAQGTWEHPQVHGFTDCFGHQLSVRCRRRDLPKVEQVKSGSGSVDSFSAWKREQFCKAFGIEDEPRPEPQRDLPKVEHAEQCAACSPEPEQWPKYYTTIDSPSSDVAFVKQVDETSYSVVYKNGRECPGFLWSAKNQSRRKQLTKDEAMALLKPTSNAYFSYHEKQKPQPQKTRVRLWVSQSAVIVRDAHETGFGKEIHHDFEGFYVENQS